MINIRPAQIQDIPFIVNGIIEAEKSGTDLISYSEIFGLNEPDLRKILSQILEEDVPGSELCLSGFLVAFDDDIPAGCMAGWIEGAEGAPSGLIKMNNLFYFIDRNNMDLIRNRLQIIATADIERENGALQIESVYTAPAFRGKGISSQLISRHIHDHKTAHPGLNKAQILLMGDNRNAIAAYAKAGFEIRNEKTSKHPEITRYLPWNTRILMEKSI